MTDALCQCGCGLPAPISAYTDTPRGYVKGEPRRFIHGHRKTVPVVDRLLDRVVWNGDEDECWERQTTLDRHGYSQIGVLRDGKRQMVAAHRVSYETFVGPIPPGLVIDHLCRRPSCINPAHLEAVTQRENVRRGDAMRVPGERQTAKTHCPKGHPYDEGNTAVRRRSTGGCYRSCRTCERESTRAWRQRKKAGVSSE